MRATELERSYPYGIVRQTADSVSLDKTEKERAALFTGAARLALPILDPGSVEEGDSPELMYQRLHGLYWLTANLARERPLLITIDDAQWADEASMAAERFLSLRIADLPMVLLLAVRTTEVGQLAVPLAEMLADPATISIRPGPLSEDGAGVRVETLLGSADPAFAAACHRATGGNPFLLEQLLKEISAEGIEPTADNAESVASLGPDTVRASVLLRLERMPSSGGPVARALAILGEHDVALRDVATLADVPEDSAADALAELERAGLVTGVPHLRFTHPILRAAIEDDMPAVERSRAHAAGGPDARRPRSGPGGGGGAPARLRAGTGRLGAVPRCGRRPGGRRLLAIPRPRCATWSERSSSVRSTVSSATCSSSSAWPRHTRATRMPESTWSERRRPVESRGCGRSAGRPSFTSWRAGRAGPPTCSRTHYPTCPRNPRRRSPCSKP